MPKVFDKASTCLLLALSLPLLFLPKINLIAFGRETAGIRLDDLVLLGFALVCFWGNFAVRRQFTVIEKNIFVITLISIFSFVMNKFFHLTTSLEVSSSIFYAFRLLEYFCFFYIGTMAIQFFHIELIVCGFFLWNLLLMLLQKAQLIGIFSVEGYIPQTNDRILGIASFGSEIGLLLNLMFCYFIYFSFPRPKSGGLLPVKMKEFFQENIPYWLLMVFVSLVVLSGARTSIAALLISFAASLPHFIQWKKPSSYIMLILTMAIASCTLILALYNYSGIISRSKGLLSFSNIELIGTVWQNITLEYDPIGRESVSMGSNDASWWMRIHKWCYALKFYVSNPKCWIQGVGPGFAMAALDGGFLRILTELGILGVIYFGKLFRNIAKQSPQLKWMVIVFLLNMVFFDAYLAYKPMSLLFLVSGATAATTSSRHANNNINATALIKV